MLMKKILLFAFALHLIGCGVDQSEKLKTAVFSPDNTLSVGFYLEADGTPGYLARYGDKMVADSSRLGFELGNNISLKNGFELVNSQTSSFDETWEQPWGEQRIIRNNYNELKVELVNANQIKLNVIFRLFDDGLGFRYEFPQQEKLGDFEVMDELTEFNLSDDHDAWSIPAYAGNRYEYLYQKAPVSAFDMVHTPLTIEAKNGLYFHMHEAALYDYPSMVVKNTGGSNLKCDLVPYSKTNPVKAYLKAPFNTPWRTIQVGETPGDLITNYMILNLNEPSKIEDTSWIKPGKYIGVWWEMFINLGTWHQGPKHAANTENVKKYIDFAAANGFSGVLVEGWNYGWDGNWMGGGTKFEFTKPYPDYDIEFLSKYAAEKGVYIIGHHETGADTENYDEQLEDAYQFLEDHGMKAVKTGYVENGDTLPNGLYHHGQYFVQHFQRVIEMGAKHKTMIVAHEPIKDTGKRRTWPNMVSREGAKGQEYNAMGGSPTDHVVTIPFTRSLSGPFDYTPGVFDIKIKTSPDQVKTTIGKELALYTIIYAPMMMANDLPENYEGHPAFEYIKAVPTDWETTQVIDGEIGDFVTIARQERNTDNWFVGSITDENPRAFKLPLDFLKEGVTYEATIYADGEDCHYVDNPTSYQINEMEVTKATVLDMKLAAGGGAAISLYPKN